VQRNCHISDARHAGDYTLCIYLLKMREYFRWEKSYAFRDNLPDGDVGEWLSQREQFWQTIEDEPFTDLPVDGEYYDPFDNEAVNASLNPYGLVYSGGLGHKCTPHFFLGKLCHQERQSDFTVLVSENEYARDLTAPPAMALGDTIFIRRESLRRMIWEKIEEWRWSKLENAMSRAIQDFNFEDNAEAALDDITDTVIDSVLLHEKGEVLAGKKLGPEWEQMLAGLPRSKTEIMIRAVRDHLADSLTTLPGLLGKGKDASLHFYFANLPNMHKDLSPALIQGYESWVTGGQREVIEELVAASKAHWDALSNQILDIYRNNPDDYANQLQVLIENNKL
ncbi:MAG: Sfum_1244 family protein, partial [Gammaproteobacteria bacterium]